MPSMRDRIRGAVLGAAIGDAMGAPVEFVNSFPEIRRQWPPAGVTGFVEWAERDGNRFARYTDDTQMAEIVLRGQTDAVAHGLTLDETMTRMGGAFAEWRVNPQGGHRAPGNACMAGAAELARGAHWSSAGGDTAGGCGSVMRAYPFGLAFHDDPARAIEWSVQHSKMTHRDPIALAACAGMAAAMVMAMRGEPVDALLSACIDAAAVEDAGTARTIDQALAESRSGVPPEVTLQRLQGWAAHEAIAAAVYVVARHPDDVSVAILEAANTPGDSDSIATLAGAMLGARLGIDALPSDWVRDVERSGGLMAMADALAALLG